MMSLVIGHSSFVKECQWSVVRSQLQIPSFQRPAPLNSRHPPSRAQAWRDYLTGVSHQQPLVTSYSSRFTL
jgi:hypothetical protein